jgi:hypothetical protein
MKTVDLAGAKSFLSGKSTAWSSRRTCLTDNNPADPDVVQFHLDLQANGAKTARSSTTTRRCKKPRWRSVCGPMVFRESRRQKAFTGSKS